MTQLSTQVEASAAMGLYDLHRVSEGAVLGVLRELFGWRKLRNLNADERKNFPGIDLADDEAQVAVQVTGTPDLAKLKYTIETFLAHKLDKHYKRLVIYVLTRKQASYSQDAIDRIAHDRIAVSGSSDILDFRDVCTKAAHADPKQLLTVLEVLRSYFRGGLASGLADVDFDPPTQNSERVSLNLVEIYLPQRLYIADLRDDLEGFKAKRARNERKLLREALTALNLRVPSGYEISGRQLITFQSLDDAQGPFARLIELGTVTPLAPREYYSNDEDRERIFKSLLRLTLQQKLYKHRVQWMHEDGLFAFLPHDDGDLLREETWVGQKTSTRRVYEKKLNKNDPNKTFICKHFAFSTDFLLIDRQWYAALTPDWYFSYGDAYRRSRYAEESLKWLKKQEVNRTVSDHFRFLTSWLTKIDQEDLFDQSNSRSTSLTFGEVVSFPNHPAVPDEAWLPLRDASDDDQDSPIKGLFDAP